MNHHLIYLINHLAAENVVDISDTNKRNAYIEKLPQNFSGEVSITLGEKKQSFQDLSFNNNYISHENRSCQIYISSNDISISRGKAYKIYEVMRKKHSLNSIFDIKLSSPTFITQTSNEEYIYIVDLNYKVRG